MHKISRAPRGPEFDPDLVQAISEHVYRQRLDLPGDKPGAAAARMIAKDGDDGVKLRKRAARYDDMTRCYLRAIKERGLL